MVKNDLIEYFKTQWFYDGIKILIKNNDLSSIRFPGYEIYSDPNVSITDKKNVLDNVKIDGSGIYNNNSGVSQLHKEHYTLFLEKLKLITDDDEFIKFSEILQKNVSDFYDFATALSITDPNTLNSNNFDALLLQDIKKWLNSEFYAGVFHDQLFNNTLLSDTRIPCLRKFYVETVPFLKNILIEEDGLLSLPINTQTLTPLLFSKKFDLHIFQDLGLALLKKIHILAEQTFTHKVLTQENIYRSLNNMLFLDTFQPLQNWSPFRLEQYMLQSIIDSDFSNWANNQSLPEFLNVIIDLPTLSLIKMLDIAYNKQSYNFAWKDLINTLVDHSIENNDIHRIKLLYKNSDSKECLKDMERPIKDKILLALYENKITYTNSLIDLKPDLDKFIQLKNKEIFLLQLNQHPDTIAIKEEALKRITISTKIFNSLLDNENLTGLCQYMTSSTCHFYMSHVDNAIEITIQSPHLDLLTQRDLKVFFLNKIILGICDETNPFIIQKEFQALALSKRLLKEDEGKTVITSRPRAKV